MYIEISSSSRWKLSDWRTATGFWHPNICGENWQTDVPLQGSEINICGENCQTDVQLQGCNISIYLEQVVKQEYRYKVLIYHYLWIKMSDRSTATGIWYLNICVEQVVRQEYSYRDLISQYLRSKLSYRCTVTGFDGALTFAPPPSWALWHSDPHYPTL